MTPLPLSSPRGGPTPGVYLQCAVLILLIGGALSHLPALNEAAAALVLVWIASQWTRLIPLARLFVGLASACFALCVALWPEAAPQLVTALVQGTGFAGLMMVLGLLRQPVKRAAVTRSATEYLLSLSPKARFGGVLAGAQFLALMFNVGIIAMVGDLTQPPDGRDLRQDPARRAMILAAMRGATLVSIWSPLSLGFAIVTAGVPGVDPMQLILVAFGFTALILLTSALWPLVPPEARIPEDNATEPAVRTPSALVKVLGASALLLGLTLGVHRLLGLSFTLCAVIVLPVFSLIWLAVEPARGTPFPQRLGSALEALADLRSESALFLAANVIGAALSIFIQASPLWAVLSDGSFATLPTLILLLLAIPLAAALYLPNSIMVVLAAQVLGPTVLGQDHPLALGLTLCIGWALAISVNPISAMTLIASKFCGVPAQKVAHQWNLRFAGLTFTFASLLIATVFTLGR